MDNPGHAMAVLRNKGTFNTIMATCLFITFILMTTMTLMNMLIGVLCEVVSAVGAHEREEADIKLLKQSILGELLKFDANGDFMISKDEFDTVMTDVQATKALHDLGVDV